MNQNVFKLLMLFLPFVFFMASCSSSKNTYSSSSKSKTHKSRNKSDRGSSVALRKDIAKYGNRYLGIPYKYAGKNPKTGFDCSGFTSYIFDQFDIDISTGSKEQARTGREIPLKRAKPGDLIFFGKGRKVSHVGIIVKNTKAGIEVIHSTSSRGIMVQNVTKSTYWKPKILFARDVISR